jgi:predicted dehydrogenase
MVNRREFLQTAVGAAAVSALRPVSARQSTGVIGANERVRMGIIGCGNRGNQVMSGFNKSPNNVFVAACDVSKERLDQTVAKMTSGGVKVDAYEDYRRVLDRKDIDAVLIATPDHWHSPITLDACAAGKDVYVEKPLSNAIEPAWKMVEAARRHNRIVQVGLQQRSWPHFNEAAALIKNGGIGKVTHVILRYGGGGNPTNDPVVPVPAGLNWDMFQGPAPRKPYKTTRERNWRYYWDYGGGLVTDWGVHLTDAAALVMGTNTTAPKLTSGIGQYVNVQNPDPDRPFNAFVASWQYDDFVMSFTNAVTGSPDFPTYGDLFIGTRGSLLLNRSGYQVTPNDAPFGGGRGRGRGGQAMPPPPPPIEGKLVKDQRGPDGRALDATPLHAENFLASVKSRQRPVADIEIGFYSTLPCLLACVAMREGKSQTWHKPVSGTV